MGKKKKEQFSKDYIRLVEGNNVGTNQNNNNQLKNKERKINWGNIIGVIAIPLMLGAFRGLWDLTQKLEVMNVALGKLEQAQSYLSSQLSEINNDVDDMHKYLYEDEGVKDQLGYIDDILHTHVLKSTQEVSDEVTEVSVETNNIAHVQSSINGTTIIGTDANGITYIADELIGQTIILVYEDKEDNKDVYFLGRFNDKYHWDGFCITNSYNKDGTLFGMCESNFDDGKRLDYVSLYKENDEEWTYTNRIVKDDKNEGISIGYRYSEDFVKNFSQTNVRVYDFILPDEFLENNNYAITKYYSGETSGGYYNDLTGNAYEIILYDDGTVKTLYCGRFIDGMFNDDTGDAWDIAYSEKLGTYLYNKGNFKEGRAVEGCETKEVDSEDIENIIIGKRFELELQFR